MSSEDTELTFVRCPSCRSLVPAVATRCRMCGHQFSSQEESSSPQQESIQEQAIPEQKEQRFVEPVAEPVMESESFNSNDNPSRSLNFKSDLQEPRREEPKREEPRIEESNWQEESKQEDSRERSSFEENQSIENRNEARSETHSDAQNENNDRQDEPKRKKRRRKRKKKPNENNFKSSEDTFEKEDSYKSDSGRDGSYNSDRKRTNEKTNSKEGVLVGWLVNYSNDSNGFSIELRAGKFFVAKQKLREDDLIIPDSAISTPHCLLKVKRGSLKIQDLMSERGTFVMKEGSDNFVPSDEVKSVEHGDKLKFGAYELLVCLVPQD